MASDSAQRPLGERDRVAGEREIDYEMRRALADERDWLADERERVADERDISQDLREARESERRRQADARADERDRAADERDQVADHRDRNADERDRAADQREIDAEVRPSEPSPVRPSGGREAQLAATMAMLRQCLASLALEVARVEEGLAKTLERQAQRDVSRADELHAHAAAARRYAESEREIARRFGGGYRRGRPS